ncbi:MAG TPA: hypothetical protein G4O16_07655 [Dehalococcoidia bacterium]|nr:hypothetical protein [Dehalococcoidia bacterium]
MVFGRRNNYRPIKIATVKSRQDDSWNITLKVLYLLLQTIDLCLTVLAVQMGYPELNPFMRAALASTSSLLVMKVFIPLLICWLVPGKYLIPAIALLAVIVGWNIKELLFLIL